MTQQGEGHRARLRQRFIAAGPRAFLDHEILEMLLAQVVPRGDTKPLAYALIDATNGSNDVKGKRPAFGKNVSAVLQQPLPLAERKTVKGFGGVMALHMEAVREAAHRIAEIAYSDAPVLGSWNAVGAYCQRVLAPEPVSQLFALLLDYRHRLVATPLTFDPSAEAEAIARETVTEGLRHAASGVILVRSDAGEALEDNRLDHTLARTVRDLGAPVSLLMHDYVISAGGTFMSLRSMGVLEVAPPFLDDSADAADGYTEWIAPAEENLARLQETAHENGMTTLRDGDLLALLLRRAVSDTNRSQIAGQLLHRFGNLGRVLATPVDELIHYLSQIADNGQAENAEAAAVHLGVVGEACQRHLRAGIMSVPPLTDLSALVRYCRAALAYAEIEQLHALFLTKDRTLIWDEVLSHGTINTAPVYPREIASRALRLGAAFLVLVHNHPTGDPEPSQADITMTQQIDLACRSVGVQVLDHIVVAEQGHVSLAETGRMPRPVGDMTGPQRAVASPRTRRRRRVS